DFAQIQKQMEDSVLKSVMDFVAAAHSGGDGAGSREIGAGTNEKEREESEQEAAAAKAKAEEEAALAVAENLFTPGDVLVLNSAVPFLVKDSLLEPAVLQRLLEVKMDAHAAYWGSAQ